MNLLARADATDNSFEADKAPQAREITTSEQAQPRLRLEFLDGLRGLSALYVVIFHAWVTARAHNLPWTVEKATMGMAFGRSAVAVFIVLSGYCLMLPIVRSADKQLRGGTVSYLRRRARRILPPYYAAVGFGLLMLLLMPGLEDEESMVYHEVTPAFTVGSLLSHLLLVHNLFEPWVTKINGAFWSVGMEWQIYFLFPTVLLPVWKRGGVGSLLAISAVIGLTPVLLWNWGSWTAFWMIILFAMGMSGAVISFAPEWKKWRDQLNWAWITGSLLLLYAGMMLWHIKKALDPVKASSTWFADVLSGGIAVCIIILCARAATASTSPNSQSGVLRLLSLRPVVQLGVFSYSLYLTHSPILALLDYYGRPLHAQPTVLLALLVGVGVPVCVLFAYGFFLLFERRFMAPATKPNFNAVQQAIKSPAP